MIPGLKAIPAFNGAGSTGTGSGGSLSLTFVASATSTSGNITIPAAALAGDWAILLMASLNITGSSVSTVLPGGWTQLSNGTVSNSTTIRAMAAHRILAASGGTSVSGMDDDRDAKIMLVFRPSTSITSTVASSWNSEFTSGNPTTQTVSASGVTVPLIVVAFASGNFSGNSPSFSTETPSMTNVTKSTSGVGIRVGYTIYNASPSDQSIDIADGGDVNGLQSGYVRFT